MFCCPAIFWNTHQKHTALDIYLLMNRNHNETNGCFDDLPNDIRYVQYKRLHSSEEFTLAC